MIRLSGYDIPEKIAIASRYLIPKALEESGILGEGQHDSYIAAVLKHYGIEDRIEVKVCVLLLMSIT